jgi:hypothetical protein
MENIYAFDLNLPCKFLNENWDYKLFRLPHIIVNTESSIHLEAINFFKSLNLRITSTELFCKMPFNGVDIHIDNQNAVDRARINYLIRDDSNSYLGFYKPKKNNVGTLSSSPTGSIPIRFKSEDVELVYKHIVKTPSVIQSGLPHGVFNPTGYRYVLAVYMSDLYEEYQLTFEQARDRFKDFIV